MYSNYIGIPFKEGGRDKNGVDCYGLPILLYKELKDIELYDKDNVGKEYFIQYHHKIYKPWFSVNALVLQELDIITFDIWGDSLPTHMGVYVGNNRFIHSMRSTGVVISKLDNYWANKIFNVWRHEELIN